MTRKFTKNLIVDIPFFLPHIFIAMCRLQHSYDTERQQFSAVTASLRSGFSRFFFFKNLKSELFRFFVFFLVKT